MTVEQEPIADAMKTPPPSRAQFTERELKRLLRHAYHPPHHGRKGRRSSGGGSVYFRRAWTLEEMLILGERTDAETARLLDRTPSSVASKRRKLDIPPATPQPPLWTREQLRWLGRLPDAEVAERTGRSLFAVAVRRRQMRRPKPAPNWRPWTSREDALVGRYRDKEVARRTGRRILPRAPSSPRPARRAR